MIVRVFRVIYDESTGDRSKDHEEPILRCTRCNAEFEEDEVREASGHHLRHAPPPEALLPMNDRAYYFEDEGTLRAYLAFEWYLSECVTVPLWQGPGWYTFQNVTTYSDKEGVRVLPLVERLKQAVREINFHAAFARAASALLNQTPPKEGSDDDEENEAKGSSEAEGSATDKP